MENNDPLIGKIVAEKYQIIELIGSGGQGSVYKARHLRLNKIVALKILRSDYMDDPKIASRFHHEAQIASQLEHPNIVSAIDHGKCKETGVVWIEMDYVDGAPLKDLLKPPKESPNSIPRLEVERSINIVIQLCDGIYYAHKRKGVLHRDIKPSNILLTDKDDKPDIVKITDFGIAKILIESEELKRLTKTETGNLEGTCLYMAPEQFKEGYKPDFPLDVYSIGCVLFELLTGHPPFKGDSDLATINMHATAKIPAPDLDSAEPVIRSRLANIVTKALAKDPSMRYQTADDLRKDLELAKLRLEQIKLGKTNIVLLVLEKLYLLLSQKKRELQSLFNLSDRAAKIWLLVGAIGMMAVLFIAGWLVFRPIHYAFGPVPGTLLRRIVLEPLIIPHKQELFDSQVANNKVLRFMKSNMLQLLDQGDISTCLQKAKQYFSLGEYEKAAEYCQTGEEICLRDNVGTMAYFDAVIESCTIHAESCLRLKQYTPACAFATYVAGHLGKADKYYGYEALIAFGIRAEANYQAGLIKEASKDYEEVMKRYTPSNVFNHSNDIQLVYTLSRAGKFYEEQNNDNADKAALLLKAALDSWKEYLRKDPENTTLLFNASVVQNDLGIAEEECKKYDLAHQYFELAKDDMAKSKGDHDINYAKILFNNSDSLWELKSWYSALQERSNGRVVWLRFYPTDQIRTVGTK